VNFQRRRELLDRVGPVDFEAARVGVPRAHGYAAPLAISWRISSARQTVILGPNLRGFGKRPDFTPAHQVDLLTGIGPLGARMHASLTKPLAGNSGSCGMDHLRSVEEEEVLG
jgi:hypothetical protein